MCFFDKKNNNSMTVNALKQLLNRREREKLFTGIPQMGAFQKDILLYFENVEIEIFTDAAASDGVTELRRYSTDARFQQ